MLGRALGKRFIDGGGFFRDGFSARVQRRSKPGEACGIADITDQRRRGDDRRKGAAKKKMATKASARDGVMRARLQRPLAHAHHGFEHHRQHRRLEAEEQRLHDPDLAISGIDPAQDAERDQAGQHEQRAGDEAALGLVQQPADIDGELMRLGPGSSMQ